MGKQLEKRRMGIFEKNLNKESKMIVFKNKS